MNLLIITTILLGHWLGDFVLQKNKLKPSKSKILKVRLIKVIKHLLPHTLLYSMVISLLMLILQICNILPILSYWNILLFFVITYITHFITDFVITLINSDLLSKNKRHKFFVSIGIDQFIHYFLLFLSIKLMWF